jgi:hypothetical protein
MGYGSRFWIPPWSIVRFELLACPLVSLTYSMLQNFLKSALDPAPPLIPLLTTIRLTENIYIEASKRSCRPLETFLLGQRLSMWPLFQKDMGAQVESLKKLAESAVGGYLSRSGIKDSAVQVVSAQCN